jgi:hypothetical protein
MKIYTQEVKDGLESAFANIKPISCASKLEILPENELINRASIQRALSNKLIPQSADKQLLYTKSLMVSTNWNANDDIFYKDYAWAARQSPLYKPNNIDHIEDKIVGAIIDVWAIDNDGNVLDNETKVEDLPDLFHICNADVIYTHWQGSEKVEEVSQLIAEIKAGEKYVSMECLFPDFDYGVLSEDKTFSIVARNEETAFLTKHLKSFGGVGIYDGHKIGRVLKDFNFSGKGYTSQPANPNSIIFGFSELKTDISFANTTKQNPFAKKNSVLINYSWNTKANTNDSEIEMSQELLEKLQAENTELKTELKSLADKFANLNSENLQKQVNDLNVKLEAAYKMVEDEKKKAKDKEEKSKADEAALNAVKAELEVKVSELNEIQLQVSKSNRVSILVEGGFDKVAAESKVSVFASLSDEQFADIAKELVSAKKAQKVEPKASVANTEIEVEATEEEVNLDNASASADVAELELLQSAIAKTLNNK